MIPETLLWTDVVTEISGFIGAALVSGGIIAVLAIKVAPRLVKAITRSLGRG